jgi:hypothetical protein
LSDIKIINLYNFVKNNKLSKHYRKLRLCLGFQALPRAFYRALGKEILCRSTHGTKFFADGWAVAGRDPRQNYLLAESQRHRVRRRRRSERRHIWAAVHCADSSTVPPVPRAPSSALGKGVHPGLPWLTVLCRELAGAVGRAHVSADGPPSAQAPLPRAPPGSRQRSNFFSFWVHLFSLLKVH